MDGILSIDSHVLLRRRFDMVFGGNEFSLDEAIWSSLNVP